MRYMLKKCFKVNIQGDNITFHHLLVFLIAIGMSFTSSRLLPFANNMPFIGFKWRSTSVFYIGPTSTADIGPTSVFYIGPKSVFYIGPNSVFYIGPTSAADIGPTLVFYIGPISAADVGPISVNVAKVYQPDVSN